MEKIEDVVIVGGGPAGAYCAYELAKNGIYPIIFDNSHPREKPCGGGISPLVIEKFPFINKFPSRGSISADFKIISPKGREVVTRGKRKGFNISRLHLDKNILDMAVKKGARLIKERVTDVKENENFWLIKTKKRSIKAKIIIGADGVNSLVRKEIIGPITKENLGLAFGYFTTGTENHYTTIKFLDIIPGYIWIFPRENHSSIGIGSELKYSKQLKKILDDFIQSYCPHIKITSKFSALLPLIKNPKFYEIPCSGKNWILIGDAAGHVDPITGEGILYAMWSGELAAKAIINNNPEEFDLLWRKEYGYDLIEGCKSKDTFYNPSIIELSVILASRSKTYSRLLYDITTSEQDYKTFILRNIYDFPKTLIEIILGRK